VWSQAFECLTTIERLKARKLNGAPINGHIKNPESLTVDRWHQMKRKFSFQHVSFDA